MNSSDALYSSTLKTSAPTSFTTAHTSSTSLSVVNCPPSAIRIQKMSLFPSPFPFPFPFSFSFSASSAPSPAPILCSQVWVTNTSCRAASLSCSRWLCKLASASDQRGRKRRKTTRERDWVMSWKLGPVGAVVIGIVVLEEEEEVAFIVFDSFSACSIPCMISI